MFDPENILTDQCETALKVFLSISSEIKEPFRKFAASYTLPWLCHVNYSAIDSFTIYY